MPSIEIVVIDLKSILLRIYYLSSLQCEKLNANFFSEWHFKTPYDDVERKMTIIDDHTDRV